MEVTDRADSAAERAGLRDGEGVECEAEAVLRQRHLPALPQSNRLLGRRTRTTAAAITTATATATIVTTMLLLLQQLLLLSSLEAPLVSGHAHVERLHV